MKSRTTSMITLKATLLTASDQCADLEQLTDHKLILAVLASGPGWPRPMPR